MLRLHSYLTTGLAGRLLSTAACRPDGPSTKEKPAAVSASQPHAATAPKPAQADATDTLHLPGGQVVQLRPSTAAAFGRLPASGLPDMPNDPAAEPLATA